MLNTEFSMKNFIKLSLVNGLQVERAQFNYIYTLHIYDINSLQLQMDEWERANELQMTIKFIKMHEQENPVCRMI